MKDYFRKYLVEFIGTFFLVFTISSAVTFGGTGVIPAISIGFALMVMVYAGGHISGGHYNPAVSLAAAIRGALPVKQVIPYWISQILGATAASMAAMPFAVAPPTFECCAYSPAAMITGEFLFTFALCYVVLQTATSRNLEGNSFYGLAIGTTVTVGAFAAGGILCYGAFNPAAALSLGMLHITCWNCIAITITANLIAAIAAAFVYKFTVNE